MKRHMIVLGVALVFAITLRHGLDLRAASQRELTATVRQVVGVEIEQAHAVRISNNGRDWVYVLRDSVWRYPNYHDAYVQQPRIDQFLRAVLTSSGSIIFDKLSTQRFGFGSDHAIDFSVMDHRGRSIAAATVGRGIPGREDNESYLRKAGEDTVYHLHANPHLALDAAAVPMIDRHLLPHALSRGTVVRIEFEDREGLVDSIWRQDIPPDPDDPRPFRGPMYRWQVQLAGKDTTCIDSNVYAYLSYLNRLRYGRLLSSEESEDSVGIGRVILKDDRGTIDTLQVVDGGNEAIVHNHRARQVSTLSKELAALVFPTASILLDTLPQSNMYDRAAPRMNGGL